jgi:putative oxidoreductase
MLLNQWDRFRDQGLLILRVGLGIMFIYHGWPKIIGGPHFWHMLGMSTGHLGIHFAPTFWGFLAALAEFGGGILLLAGFLTRLACAFLFIDMFVATSMHLGNGQGLAIASHAIECGIVFLSLILIGPGRFSIDAMLCGKK